MDGAPLQPADVAQYLLDLGLLTEHDLVEAGLTVFDVSRRNTNYRVEVGGAGRFFVKQPRYRYDGVRHEAAAYERLAASAATRDLVPRRCAWDPQRQILVTAAVPGGRDLDAHHAATGRFSKALGARAGRVLARLHETTVDASAPVTPWVVRLGEPDLDTVVDLSAANFEIIRIVQGSATLPRALEALARDLEPDAFVHNDLRADNVIVATGSAPVLADWETAGTGDPAWDLGGLFGSYLAIWLASIPVAAAPPERWPSLARRPLHRIQPLMGALWCAYRERRDLDAQAARRLLDRAVRAAGAWLVQFAFERSALAMSLDSSAKLMLQLGHNTLTRPLEGQVHLLGVPLGR